MKKYAVIDIGGTMIKYGLVDHQGKLLKKMKWILLQSLEVQEFCKK